MHRNKIRNKILNKLLNAVDWDSAEDHVNGWATCHALNVRAGIQEIKAMAFMSDEEFEEVLKHPSSNIVTALGHTTPEAILNRGV